MNIVNKLTLRHLKQNMKRSIVTVIGIIVSVAMITAVAVSACSGSRFLVDLTKYHDGDWIAQYTNTSLSNFNKINSDETTKGAYVVQDGSSAKMPNKEFGEKNIFSIRNVESVYFDNQNYKVVNGRLPEKSNEIVVSKYYYDKYKLNWKIGENVDLELGTRNLNGENVPQWSRYADGETFTTQSTKTYKFVGLVSSKTNSEYSLFTHLDKSTLNPETSVDIISITGKLSMSTYDHIEQMAKDIKCDNYKIHSDLLRYSGFIDDASMALSIYGIIGILLVIIIIASVTLIYNAFAISINERSKYLGMLASVGATKKQKRGSVYFEGAILGAIGIPIGVISGIVGIGVTFKAISPMLLNMLNNVDEKLELNLFVPPLAIVFCIILSVITILISAYVPGKKASKTTAIEAIRQSKDIKVKSKQLKTSKLTRKLFGYEGELAVKNLKRNRKKFRVITASLAMSVILFLSVNSFSNLMSKSFELANVDMNFDVSLTAPISEKDKIKDEINSYDSIESVKMVSTTNICSKIDGSKVDKEFATLYNKYCSAYYNAKFSDNSPLNIVGLDDNEFNKYCADNKIDSKIYYDKESPRAILENYVYAFYYNDDGSPIMKEFTPLKFNNGENVELFSINSDNGELTPFKNLNIGNVLNKKVLDINGNTTVKLVMPMSMVADYLNGYNAFTDKVDFYINSKNPKELANNLDKFVQSASNSEQYHIYDYASVAEANRSLFIIKDVFLYGFITLITLISVANIFNTISTGISLRRREFAMIKSVGMTPKSFKKMVSLESVFYGLKSLAASLPISLVLYILMFKSLSSNFSFSMLSVFNWQAYIIAIVAVFIIITIALIYSVSKIKNDNIIETLKNDDN